MRRQWRAVLLAGVLVGACGDRAAVRGVPAGAASVPASRTGADSAFADSVLRTAEDIGASVTETTSDNPAPVRDPAAIRSTLVAYAGETYIGELFAAHDSTNFRWPDRTRDPLRVWIQPSTLDGYTEAHRMNVRDAFDPWVSTGIPVAFDFTEDSSRAEILITWVARYESRTTGRTRWVRDQHGWITGAGIELALAQPDGRALGDAAVRAIARHEIGHLLGLDHTADESNIMAARIRVSELSEADRNTVRLVYKLPPGRLRTP
jgi:hypothetical protein